MRALVNVVLGTLSVAPIAWFLFSLFVEPLLVSARPTSIHLFLAFEDAIPILGILVLLIFILSCSTVVPSPKRGLWLVVLVSLNLFVLPFFWFWYLAQCAFMKKSL
jgi:hypothetical protein